MKTKIAWTALAAALLIACSAHAAPRHAPRKTPICLPVDDPGVGRILICAPRR